MVARIFEVPQVLLILGIAVAGFLISVIANAVSKKEPKAGIWPGIEAAILAVLGGLMARSFVSILLGTANDSHGAGLLVGWGLFVFPGLVDTFAWIHSNQPILTKPETLLAIAGVVGAFTGAMSGGYRIYNWEGLGWLAFPLDVTWALAGNTVGCLLHIVNIGWGDHADRTDDNEARKNAHHYKSGFGLRYSPRFAFTQGSVMSNLGDGHGTPLYKHEMTHVWQNRGFGPMYTLTYVAWLLVWLIPAMIAGVVIKGASGLFAGPNNWCYFNCPWEAWAYAVQREPRTNIAGVDEEDRKMIWPAKFVIAWAVPFFGLATVLAVLGVVSAWRASAPATKLPVPLPAHKNRAQVISIPTPITSAWVARFTSGSSKNTGLPT